MLPYRFRIAERIMRELSSFMARVIVFPVRKSGSFKLFYDVYCVETLYPMQANMLYELYLRRGILAVMKGSAKLEVYINKLNSRMYGKFSKINNAEEGITVTNCD